MKNNILIFCFIISLQQISAQVPKKVVAEHFTNTLCSICAARNPGFYTNLDNHPGILHLAVHPSAPYAGCTLSQHNVSENNSRTNYYGIFGGTPRIVIQGSVIPSSANYNDATMFTPFTGQSSPATIKITQTKYANDSIKARVVVKTAGTHSLGNLRLFIALAEDTIFFSAPNGESKHHDVFRKSLGGAQGITMTLPAIIGDSVVNTFTSTVHPSWNFSRIFTMAILQEEGNKALVQAEAVLASGGQIITGLKTNSNEMELRIAPNPATNKLYVCLNSGETSDFYIIDAIGREVLKGNFSSYTNIDISGLETGLYTLVVQNEKGKVNKKLIKE
ncbi:MAG: hypothetical protein K0S32_1050 [Bacteroidetes bacterium]|jgi:hypothetical protein|nr:hypothetical protein [Bacteroidota bacterium]